MAVSIPAAVTGLHKASVVMIRQLRTLSHDRLTHKLSSLSDKGYRRAVQETIRDYFEL